MNILDEIVQHKRSEIARRKKVRPLSGIKAALKDLPQVRPLAEALHGEGLSVIAEIKKASPSRGILDRDFDHRRMAREFESGGASALSILTDEKFFQGRVEHVTDAKEISSLPILRKDFILDEYQVYESRLIGADAILLIVRILEEDTLKELHDNAVSLGMDVLVETHSEKEIDTANRLGARLIGINNRDLDTFGVSIEQSIKLRRYVRDGAVTVSESGIKTPDDLARLRKAGFHAVLIGEGLVGKDARTGLLKSTVHYG